MQGPKPWNAAWLADIVGGGVVGGVIGAIVAVNVVIAVGPDQGYEASLREVFEHNPSVGTATVAILLCGPVLGAVVARRLRRQRDQGAGSSSGVPSGPRTG